MTNKIIGIVLIVIGVALGMWGYDVYDSVSSQVTRALNGETPIIVPLFSPRSAKLFGQIADFNAPLHLVVISEAIDVVQQNAPVVSRAVAKSRDGAGMVAATLARYAEISP